MQCRYRISTELKLIPEICQNALKKDLVKWLKDLSRTSLWGEYLPSSENQRELVLHGYFACKILRSEQTYHIRCDPNFRGVSPRYDFVAEEHCGDNVPQLNKKGILPETATPSKVLMLYRNPIDNELRAITHPCEYNVRHGEKVTSVFKTGEVYHLDMSTKPCAQDLLFNDCGEPIKFNSLPPSFLPPSLSRPVCMPDTTGTQVTRLGALLFCVQQHPGLLDDAETILSGKETESSKKKAQKSISWVLCMREYRDNWPSWFCET